jgi:hypothetical protein
MARLAAAVVASALPPLRWLEPNPVTGRWLRGVARAAANPPAQVGLLAGEGGDWIAEQFKFLPLDLQLSLPNQDGRTDGGRSCKPVSF